MIALISNVVYRNIKDLPLEEQYHTVEATVVS